MLDSSIVAHCKMNVHKLEGLFIFILLFSDHETLYPLPELSLKIVVGCISRKAS
jgi:hypothetical protein